MGHSSLTRRLSVSLALIVAAYAQTSRGTVTGTVLGFLGSCHPPREYRPNQPRNRHSPDRHQRSRSLSFRCCRPRRFRAYGDAPRFPDPHAGRNRRSKPANGALSYSGNPTFLRSALSRGSPPSRPRCSRSTRSRNQPIRIGPRLAARSSASKTRSLSPKQA